MVIVTLIMPISNLREFLESLSILSTLLKSVSSDYKHKTHRTMKSKLATLLALAAGFVGNPVSAQEYTLTLDVTAASSYVFRGIELGDNTIHPSFEFGMGDFYAGVWLAQPIENRGAPENFDDEVDFYAGQTFALNDSTSVDVGGTVYHYPGGNDTVEFYAGISHELDDGVSVNLYVYRDFELDTWTAEGSAGYSLPLTDTLSLDLAGYIGLVEPDTDGGDYTYYGADVILPVELRENVTLSLGAHWADHNLDNTPDNRFYGSASLTFGF